MILITYHISPTHINSKIEQLGQVIEQLNKKLKNLQIILNGDLNYNIRQNQIQQIAKLLNKYKQENIYRTEENEYARQDNNNNVNYIDYIYQINSKIEQLEIIKDSNERIPTDHMGLKY